MSNTLFTNFNKLISTELSEYLIRYTKQNDLLEVADKTGVSFSTIDNVRRQRAVLKPSNSEAMTELTRLAIRNYTHRNAIDSRLTKEYEKGVNVRG